MFDPAAEKTKYSEWHQHTAANKMKVSHDKRSVQVKDINFQHEDAPESGHAICIDFQHDDEIKISLSLSPMTDAFSIKDGNIYFGCDKNDGHINMKFLPFMKVQGSIQMNGEKEEFDGNGMCCHQFQGLKPYLSASRWNVLYFQADLEEGETAPNISAFMTQIRTPNLYDRATFNLGSIFVNGKLTGVSVGNQIDVENVVRDPESGYNIPGTFKYTWDGITFDEEPFHVTCEMTHGLPCRKLNVLDHLPFFLRKAIEAFVTRPFAYYWLERGELQLKIGDQESTVRGWVMQELSLINTE